MLKFKYNAFFFLSSFGREELIRLQYIHPHRGLQIPSEEQQGEGEGCNGFEKREVLGLGIKWGEGGGGGWGVRGMLILITTICISLNILCGPTKDTSTQNAQQQCCQSSRQSNQPERGSSTHTKGPFKLTRNKSEYCNE